MFTWLEKLHADMDKIVQNYWNPSLNDVFFIENKTLEFFFSSFPLQILLALIECFLARFWLLYQRLKFYFMH